MSDAGPSPTTRAISADQYLGTGIPSATSLRPQLVTSAGEGANGIQRAGLGGSLGQGRLWRNKETRPAPEMTRTSLQRSTAVPPAGQNPRAAVAVTSGEV